MTAENRDLLASFPGVVVVPGATAARVLRAELDLAQRDAGNLAWRAPDVLPWGAWLERGFDLAVLPGEGAGEPLDATFLLSREQELAAWESVIAANGAPAGGADEAARLAQEAWRIVHEWALPEDAVFAGPGSDDVFAFRRWQSAYRERCAALGAIDHARLAARAAPPGGPARAHGFVDVPPALARAFAAAGVDAAVPDASDFKPAARVYPDREAELGASAAWAAEQVDAGPGTVVVAVEGLARSADLARACFADVFTDPNAVAFGADESLARAPAVAAALELLDVRPVMRWDAFSAVLLGTHTRGARAERGARARFDAELRALGRAELPLPWVSNLLAAAARPCPELAALLPGLAGLVEQAPRRQRMADWVEHFDACLRVAGWPGEGEVPAAVTARWAEACDRLQRLDAVLAPVTRGDALARLRRIVADAPLAPPPPGARVFVVTPAQAAVLHPRALWLAGCTSHAFAAPGSPSPLLPFAVQREHGVPGAWANRDLNRARRLLAGLAASGAALVASYPAAEGDVRLSPSPLVPGLAEAPAPAAGNVLPPGWQRQRATARFETLEDVTGSTLAEAARVPGGVAVLAAQAACPFRAFARHRLGARAPEEPRPGIDARHKGIAVHRALASVWMRLGTQAALADLGAEARAQLLADAVRGSFSPMPFETPLERALYFVERERLYALLDVWLEYELARAPFAVIAAERAESVRFEGLEFTVRVDRVDRLKSDRQLVVDYKTGLSSPADWVPPRMNEPQLPFYALAVVGARAAGVAFAQLRTGRYAWLTAPRGADRDEADTADEWDALVEQWRSDLASLCAGVRAGDALPDPKLGSQTCRRCDQHVFCRVAEIARAAEDGREDDPGEGDADA